jgi:carbamoyl-phosphate synthase large subunit
MAAQEMGYEAIMVNCNPETVSTDFDIADKLYFEPVFWERVLDIFEHEKPEGVILQVGGQTALKLGKRFVKAQHQDLRHTEFEMIDFAEDRGEFSNFLKKLNIPFPEYGTARTADDALSRSPNRDRLSGSHPAKLCSWRAGNENRRKRGRASGLRRADSRNPSRK